MGLAAIFQHAEQDPSCPKFRLSLQITVPDSCEAEWADWRIMVELPIEPEPRKLPKLGKVAYVAAENANCLYEPKPGSAIRCTPPVGTEVTVIRDDGAWVCVLVFGKKAWSPKGNLSPAPVSGQETVEAGVQPRFIEGSIHFGGVEYGPRGGRFVRTRSGFRRYL